MIRSSIAALVGILALACSIRGAVAEDIFFANGLKIGEVDQTSAIVWTRLTATPTLNEDGAQFLEVPRKGAAKAVPVPASIQIPENLTLADMLGAVPGRAGFVRFSWWSDEEDVVVTVSDWIWVDQEADYTCRHALTDLEPGTRYFVRIEARDDSLIPSRQTSVSHGRINGSFRTAPPVDQESPITFAMTTCQEWSRRDDDLNGHKIYKHLANMQDLDFSVHAGDLEYYDRPDPWCTNVDFARFRWNRFYGMYNQRDFHLNAASYFMKDDHDTVGNDVSDSENGRYGELTWDQGLDIFREQFPVLHDNYRTIRWGKDLQIWLVENRDYRSLNKEADGPTKTIWGETQKQWFFDTVKQSDATFKILVSPTPVVGPDRGEKKDNHANPAWQFEGDQIRSFISQQDNMFVANGDRHWQYVSVHNETGVKEFSCGPASNKHAGGWNKRDFLPEHRYLKVQGGFLTITVDRIGKLPVLIARHYNPDGEVSNTDYNWAVPKD